MRSSARTEPFHFLLFPAMKSSQCMNDAVVFNDGNRITGTKCITAPVPAQHSPREGKASFPLQWIYYT